MTSSYAVYEMCDGERGPTVLVPMPSGGTRMHDTVMLMHEACDDFNLIDPIHVCNVKLDDDPDPHDEFDVRLTREQIEILRRITHSRMACNPDAFRLNDWSVDLDRRLGAASPTDGEAYREPSRAGMWPGRDDGDELESAR